MAFDYNNAFKRIIAKATLLEERYKILLESRNAEKAKVAQLQQEIALKDKELEQLRLEVEYLKVATTIAPSREQIEEARAIITEMVRDIDRCITDLSD